MFEQRPNSHLNGNGCLQCGHLRTNNKNILGLDIFIKRSEVIHKNKYDYTLVMYKTANKHVKIICPDHGVFKQTPKKHMAGQGCPICARESKKYNELSTDEFIKKAEVLHKECVKQIIMIYSQL